MPLIDTQHFRDVYKQRPADAASMTIGHYLSEALLGFGINQPTLATITNVNEAMHYLIDHALNNDVFHKYLSFFNRQLS